MALSVRLLCRNRFHICNITLPVKWVVQENTVIKYSTSSICFRSQPYWNDNNRATLETKYITYNSPMFVRHCSKQGENENPPEKKVGLVQRLKHMYRHYWYVAIPVHVVTSAIWFGCFYYAVRSGLDVIAILQSLGVSEKLITPLKESSAGYVALALALYKAATPLRYTVTVGGTTYAIRKLTAVGLIKPVPSKERIKEMIQEKKENYKEVKQHYTMQMKEKRSNIMGEMKRYKSEISKKKNKFKRSLNGNNKPQ